jgi:two-component system sensor histidine kinase HydH
VPANDLRLVEQEIRRVERSLQMFLDFARPPKPERRPLDLTTAVERAFGLISGRAAQQKVTLRFTKPEGAIVVEADADQIQQLLVNLTLNALDAMPCQGELRIELGHTADGQIELRVLDTGQGITPQMLPRLFEPFVTTKETGAGLGLAVSRRIVEDHGGKLWAENRPEGGACFTCRLDARRQASAVAG